MARAAAVLLLCCVWLQLASAADQIRAVNASSRPARPLTVDPVTGEIAATATWYTYPSGGNSCHLSGAANTGMCVAPSDGFAELWDTLVPSGQQCTTVAPFTGPCSSCGGKVRVYAARNNLHFHCCPRSHVMIFFRVLSLILSLASRTAAADMPVQQPVQDRRRRTEILLRALRRRERRVRAHRPRARLRGGRVSDHASVQHVRSRRRAGQRQSVRERRGAH